MRCADEGEGGGLEARAREAAELHLPEVQLEGPQARRARDGQHRACAGVAQGLGNRRLANRV